MMWLLWVGCCVFFVLILWLLFNQLDDTLYECDGCKGMMREQDITNVTGPLGLEYKFCKYCRNLHT